jgi:predicted GNAT family acetyltransferase
MILKTFKTAAEFLAEARPALEAAEAANNLMYGLALRLERYPERIHIPPFFAVMRYKRDLVAAALMTPPHNLVVLSTNPDYSAEAFDLAARNLRNENWPVPAVLGPNEAALSFAKVWQSLTGQPYALNQHERVYELRKVVPPPRPSGRMRLATMADLDLAGLWVHDFQVEAVPHQAVTLEEALEGARVKISDQDFYVWDDGQPVALAGRNRPTPNGYCVGPVYTPPAYRAKGYATALTAELSQILLELGKKFTCLFTNLANPTSNSIYKKIGYKPVCDFDLYEFGSEPSS